MTLSPEEIARLRELEAKATQPDAWRNGDKFVFMGALVEHAPSLLSLAERVGKLEEALREALDCLVVGDPAQEHPRTEGVIRKAHVLLTDASPRPE